MNEIFFQKREDIRETPEVHVAGFCIREEAGTIKVLIAKRAKNRKLYPCLFEGCGGQLKYCESFNSCVKRHFRTEMGITIDVIENIHLFYSIIQPNGIYIPGIVFLCKYISGIAYSCNHSKIKWVSLEELKNIDDRCFIPNVKNEILQLIEMYSKIAVIQ